MVVTIIINICGCDSTDSIHVSFFLMDFSNMFSLWWGRKVCITRVKCVEIWRSKHTTLVLMACSFWSPLPLEFIVYFHFLNSLNSLKSKIYLAKCFFTSFLRLRAWKKTYSRVINYWHIIKDFQPVKKRFQDLFSFRNRNFLCFCFELETLACQFYSGRNKT